MGNGSGHFNPLFKMNLGFLEVSRGEILIATNSGTYRIFNHSDPCARNSNSLVRAVMVPITGTTSSSKRLLLGLRHSGGTDGDITRAGWNRNALEVHSDSTNTTENDGSHFLDTSPWSRQSGDKDDGAGFVVGANVLLQADATDADGIARVHCFFGNCLIGESFTPPYSVVREKMSVGPKTITAVAYDTTGRWSQSVPVNFTVYSPPPSPSRESTAGNHSARVAPTPRHHAVLSVGQDGVANR